MVRDGVLVGLVVCKYAGNKVFFGRGVWMNHIGGLALKRFNSYVLITPLYAIARIAKKRANATPRIRDTLSLILTFSDVTSNLPPIYKTLPIR